MKKAGDRLFIRGGIYDSEGYKIHPRGQYYHDSYDGKPGLIVNSESGTANKPVIIQNYEDEEVIFILKQSTCPRPT